MMSMAIILTMKAQPASFLQILAARSETSASLQFDDIAVTVDPVGYNCRLTRSEIKPGDATRYCSLS